MITTWNAAEYMGAAVTGQFLCPVPLTADLPVKKTSITPHQ